MTEKRPARVREPGDGRLIGPVDGSGDVFGLFADAESLNDRQASRIKAHVLTKISYLRQVFLVHAGKFSGLDLMNLVHPFNPTLEESR